MSRNPNRRGGISDVAAGVIAIAVVLVGVYLGFTKAIPFRSHFEIKAAFTSSNNLRANSPVRIAGVAVGKVTRVESDGKEGAVVTMRINKGGRPLHADAKASIRPRIFLEGNFFVDLEPGSPSAPELDEGDVIPVTNTRTPVQFDQILSALQSDTREDLKTLLDEYGRALDGNGARGFRRSTRYWKPAYRDGAIVSDATLGTDPQRDLNGYIKGAGATAAALDRNGEALKSLITDLHTTVAAFAREDAALRGTFAELPRTLRAAQPALGDLNASFPPLRRLVADLRPGVRSTGPTIDASRPLVAQVRGLVSEPELRGLTADLRRTIPSLARTTRRGVPLARESRLLASCQNETVLPWSRDTVKDPAFPSSGPVYQETVKTLPGLAGESRSGDANGQWFRVLAAGSNNLVNFGPIGQAVTQFPIGGVNPPEPATRPVNVYDQPCETQQTPDLSSKPAAPPPQRRIDMNDPIVKARETLARTRAVRWLRRQVKAEGLTDVIRVTDREATPSLIKRLASVKRAQNAARDARIKKALGR